MPAITLPIIKDFLSKDGMLLELLPPTTDLPLQYLKISLGKDYKNRDISAILWLETQTETAPGNATNALKSPNVFMQILFAFPFNYIESALLPTARYILMLNKTMAFPGLGLSEPDHALYYKYTLTFPEGRVQMDLLKDFIGLVQFVYDTFAPKIESIANGSISSLEDLYK